MGAIIVYLKDDYKHGVNLSRMQNDADAILDKEGYNYKENHKLREAIRSCVFFGIEIEFIEALLGLKASE